MIGKLIRGTSMRGLLDYLLAPIDQKKQSRPRVAIVGGTFAGTTAHEIAREFSALRSLRPKLNVAVVHETLRLPAGADEPSDEQWRDIARHWAEAMGFQAWVAVAHGDGHIHIAASRIRIDGSVVSDKHDWTLSERIVRDIERLFGLEQIEPSHLLSHDKDWIQQKTPTKAQTAIADKTGLPLPAEIVASVIDGLLAEPISVTDFVHGLETAGIDVRPNIASTGKVSGLAYALGGVIVTARAMGRAYTWAHLQRRGLAFDPKRDLPALYEVLGRSLLTQKNVYQSAGQHPEAFQSKEGQQAITRAAQAFAATAVANFIDAAGTDQFMAFQGTGNLARGFVDISTLLQPAKIIQMLDGARFDAVVRAELLDPRIVVITELGKDQLDKLDENGLEPFAVSEIGPGIFEACIRLLPATEPAPTGKVLKKAAAIVARIAGGIVSDVISLPGFINPSRLAGNRRRIIVMLRKMARVVAEHGAILLGHAQRQLDRDARRQQGGLPITDEPSSGSLANTDVTLRESDLAGEGGVRVEPLPTPQLPGVDSSSQLTIDEPGF